MVNRRLPVEFTADGPCRIADGSLLVDGAGLCTIVASQPGDLDWAPAAPVTTTLRIDRGRQSIELQPIEDVAVGATVPVAVTTTD